MVPYMLKTDDNPDGVPLEEIQQFDRQIRDDRPGFLATFGKHFYGVNFINRPVSQDILEWTNSLAFIPLHKKPCLAVRESFFQTDFRGELESIKIPTLLIHGDKDKNSSCQSNKRTSCLIDFRFIV
jgi:pimeloyl-ACP methyl ester carboxylesterase